MTKWLYILGGAIVIGAIMAKRWIIPEAGKQWLPYLVDAERRYHLPSGLLQRVAYQESRFRPDIISGETVSSAGAQGIMQIVPKWHPDVNPLNPVDAIYYAGGYLADLYKKYKDWKLALAAYNWGPGNVDNALRSPYSNWMDALPAETYNYVTDISKDVTGV